MHQDVSTLNPVKSKDRLKHLREAAESEIATIPPGVISNVGGDIQFDFERAPLSKPTGAPEDAVGAATYSGPNSPHIGNGHGAPQ